MITTDNGERDYYLDKGDTKFLWDIIFDEKREMEIKIHVNNPSSEIKNLVINLTPSDDEEWHIAIDKIEGPEDDDIVEVNRDHDFVIYNVDSGEQIMLVLKVYYEGKDKDSFQDSTVHAAFDEDVDPVELQIPPSDGSGFYERAIGCIQEISYKVDTGACDRWSEDLLCEYPC